VEPSKSNTQFLTKGSYQRTVEASTETDPIVEVAEPDSIEPPSTSRSEELGDLGSSGVIESPENVPEVRKQSFEGLVSLTSIGSIQESV